MTFAPKIQSFIPSTGTATHHATPVWDIGKIIVGRDGSLFRFNFNSSTQEASVSTASGDVDDDLGTDQAGNILISSSGLSNFDSFAQYDIGLNNTANFGTSSSFWNLPNGLPYPLNGVVGQLSGGAPMFAGSTTRGLTDPDTGLSGFMVWFLVGGVYSGYVFFTERVVAPVRGPTNPSNKMFFVGSPHDDLDAQHIALYSMALPAGGITTIINTIVPTTIDAAWTHFLLGGATYDGTDGNLILTIGTDDSVSTLGYICKFSTRTGALLWKVAVPTGVHTDSFDGRYGRIRHGKFCYIVSPGTVARVYVIDTHNGSSSSFTAGVEDIASNGRQCFDDTTGAIFVRCTYDYSGAGPAPLNDTPSSFSNQWAALYVTEAFAGAGGFYAEEF